MVIYLRRDADLHMAQLMPLPLTVSCSSKSRLALPEWFCFSGAGLPRFSDCPEKSALNKFSSSSSSSTVVETFMSNSSQHVWHVDFLAACSNGTQFVCAVCLCLIQKCGH